ncbi:hypothetical protein SAMN04488135_110179 [Pollutimonas bauzanensis]|uniref:Uncharacterized protein n=1 Tax=Pollutimonas bauzanensis TaxID=658167 RepID=A0A1M5YUN9_9BURK|nr:hypothetical protein SAMN04488135_110179 [Pollutimonas bauzanensis]
MRNRIGRPHSGQNIFRHEGYGRCYGYSRLPIPDLALLSIKHYQEEGKDFGHWVVLKCENSQSFVLDSASYLPSNIRYDFDAMQLTWFIEVKDACRS